MKQLDQFLIKHMMMGTKGAVHLRDTMKAESRAEIMNRLMRSGGAHPGPEFMDKYGLALGDLSRKRMGVDPHTTDPDLFFEAHDLFDKIKTRPPRGK